MLRALIAVLVAMLSVPVHAQEESVADLFFTAALGLAENATVNLPGLTGATVLRVRPGIYIIDGPDKARALISVTEPETCLLKVAVKATPPQPGYALVDARRIEGIEVNAAEPAGDLNGWTIVIDTPVGTVTVVTDSETTEPSDFSTSVKTSVTREAIVAAAEALRARCPAEAGETAASDVPAAVDLMAVAVTGLADGAAVFLGESGTVARTAPGTFAVTGTDGSAGPTVTFTEPSTCVFVMTYAPPGGEAMAMQFDANKIRTFAVAPDTGPAGYNAFEITLEGEEGMLNGITADGLEPRPDNQGNATTSLTQAEIEAAVAALQTNYCPGPGA